MDKCVRHTFPGLKYSINLLALAGEYSWIDWFEMQSR